MEHPQTFRDDSTEAVLLQDELLKIQELAQVWINLTLERISSKIDDPKTRT
jgi:hypothetical protein